MNRLFLFFSFTLFLSSALAADHDNSAFDRPARHKTLRRRQSTTTGTTIATTTSTSSSSSATASAKPPSIRAAWVADWIPFDNFSWGSYSILTWAFAVTTSDPNNPISILNETAFGSFVETAQKNKVKAFVSLGGAQGSIYFSTLCAVDSRTKFVDAIVNMTKVYKLDGIDFDWEYPNASDGTGLRSEEQARQRRCDEDSERGTFSCSGMWPFNGDTGNPLTDVTDFAKVLNHVAIMAYDVFGPWSKGQTGPNAPLQGDECMKSALPEPLIVTADSAVKMWTEANMPPDQIVLGIAAYGHSYSGLKGSLDNSNKGITKYPQFNSTPLGYPDAEGPKDPCGDPQPHSGVFTFEGLKNAGYLDRDGNAMKNVTYEFDNCTRTPFLHDEKNDILISYDNHQSFKEKGQYIVDKKLAGFAMWHAANDYEGLLVTGVEDPFFHVK
ncbi:glycoside hydrolase [Hymenopellis radicata]|nr:glycoside hydrolase [Hymenopellis radicata]